MAQDPTLDDAIDSIDDLILDGDFDQAQQELDDAVETFGERDVLAVLEAELLLENGQYKACVSKADEVLDDIEDTLERAQLLSFKAYALYYDDLVDQARHAFNQAVQQDPEAWSAIVGRATVHDYLGFYQAAMIDLDRAVALDDQEAQPFTIRGVIYLRFGEEQKAKKDFAYALECDPWDDEARLYLARLQALDGESASARETLELLVDEGDVPEFVVPGALLRSQLSLGLGSTDAAMEDAAIAIELAPDEPWGYLQKAACQITAADPGAAIETLKEAESLMRDSRDYPDLHALRASAYEQLGKSDKAAAAHDQAEGASRLPGIVYGDILDPASNVPVNPNKPVDVRQILEQIFGDPEAAPEGYADKVREVLDQIPAYVEQNPGLGQIEVELPPVEGMEGSPGNLVIQVNQPQQS
jgi:tetratricopeptide (TPR) repeat protein